MHETLVPIDEQIQQVLTLHTKRIENKQSSIFTESLTYGIRDRERCIDLIHLGTVDTDHHAIRFWLKRFVPAKRDVTQPFVQGHILHSSTPLKPNGGQTLITRCPLGEQPWDSEYALRLVPTGLDDVLATFAI